MPWSAPAYRPSTGLLILSVTSIGVSGCAGVVPRPPYQATPASILFWCAVYM
jgi:hypothetical protein